MNDSCESVKIFRLQDDSLGGKMFSFINSSIEENIAAFEEGISVFIIECRGKFRKGKQSSYDIIELAYQFGGGEHEYRSAASLGKVNYEEVIRKIYELTSTKVFKKIKISRNKIIGNEK